MKTLILILMLLISIQLKSQCIIDSSKFFIWGNDIHMLLKDLPSNKDSFKNNVNVQLNTTILFSFGYKENKLSFCILGVIKKEGSISNYIDMSIENHESKHLDITELFARKLRAKIIEEINNESSEIALIQKSNSLYKKYNDSLLFFQEYYDRITDFGNNHYEQKKINEKIAADLDFLLLYKDPLIRTR